MSSPSAFVLLGPNPKASPPAVVADVATTFPSAPAVTFTVAQKTGALLFHFGEVTVQASILPMPMPADHLEPCYKASWLWPTAEDDLRDHAMMLTVTAEGGDRPVDRMAPMTMLIAGVLGTCPQAAGVFWDGAEHLVKGKVFRDFAAQKLPGRLPLLLWVGCPAGKKKDGTCSGHTVGMGQFGLPEIETSDAPVDVPVLRQRLADLAEHLVTKAREIKDGATVGRSATQTITVSYGESQFGLKGRVMRLHHHRNDAGQG
jgi:hypothetical protein